MTRIHMATLVGSETERPNDEKSLNSGCKNLEHLKAFHKLPVKEVGFGTKQMLSSAQIV